MKAVEAKQQFITPYIGDLRSVIGYYTGWVPESLVDKVSEADAYELLKNDEAIFARLDLLSLFSAGEYCEIKTKQQELTAMGARALGYIQDFTHARKSLIHNGNLFGMSLQKKYWKKVTWKEYPGMVWEVPFRIKEVDRRRLRVERDLGDKRKAYWTIWDLERDKYLVMVDRAKVENYEGPAAQDYVWYFFEQEELNPMYRGQGEVLFRLAYIKNLLIQYWADLCEKWSKPFVTAYINTMKGAFNAEAGEGYTSAATRADNLIAQFEKMTARNVLVLDKDGDKVEFHEHGTTGNNIIREFLNYADEKINDVILGAELSASAGSGVGSYAMAQVHKNATDSKVLYNRYRAAERYKIDLVCDFYLRNRSNLYRLGYDVPDVSEIEFDIKVKSEEIKNKLLGANDVDATKIKIAGQL